MVGLRHFCVLWGWVTPVLRPWGWVKAVLRPESSGNTVFAPLGSDYDSSFAFGDSVT